jgi:hypothetical protein
MADLKQPDALGDLVFNNFIEMPCSTSSSPYG